MYADDDDDDDDDNDTDDFDDDDNFNEQLGKDGQAGHNIEDKMICYCTILCYFATKIGAPHCH